MKSVFSSVLAAAALAASLSALAQAADEPAGPAIRHRFLAVDESRSKLHYVDQTDESKNWEISYGGRYRDIQLIGGGKILINTGSGYREYDLATRKQTAEFADKQLAGSETVRRTTDGRTIVGCNQKADGKSAIAFYELDKDNKIVRQAVFPALSALRLGRLTPRGNLLFGANSDLVIEATLEGKIVRQVKLAGIKTPYHSLAPAGRLLVSSGYSGFVAEFDDAGKELRRWGNSPAKPDKDYHFFCGLQVLKNGNIVACNWTGHGANDSVKAPQLLEFSPDGKRVWSWHDPKLAGTLVGVIVLDDLDVSKLCDDSSGILSPVK